MTEEALRKGSLPEAPVLLEGKLKKRADITFKETVRIRRVIVGILPSVQITSLNRDAKSTKSAYSSTLRLTVSPAKSRSKVVEKDLLPPNQVAYSRKKSRRNPSRFYGRATKSLGPKRSVHVSKGTLRHVKNSGSKGSIAGSYSHEHAPKFKDRSQE